MSKIALSSCEKEVAPRRIRFEQSHTHSVPCPLRGQIWLSSAEVAIHSRKIYNIL